MDSTQQSTPPKRSRRKYRARIACISAAQRAANPREFATNVELFGEENARLIAYTQATHRPQNDQLVGPSDDIAAAAAGLDVQPANPIPANIPNLPPYDPNENGEWDLSNHPGDRHPDRNDRMESPAAPFAAAFLAAPADDSDLRRAIEDGVILVEDVGEDVGLVRDEVVDNVGQRLAELRTNLNPHRNTIE